MVEQRHLPKRGGTCVTVCVLVGRGGGSFWAEEKAGDFFFFSLQAGNRLCLIKEYKIR